jgi:hypothetical protein
MKPILHTGDSVQISSLSGQSPKIGEILLLCDQQGNPLIHRLIRRRYCKGVLCLQTKGDACPGFDGFVPAGQVIGRICRITYHSDTTTATGRSEIKDLGNPFMRLKALVTVSFTLLSYYLRRAGAVLKGQR